jgi:hypothetical protein
VALGLVALAEVLLVLTAAQKLAVPGPAARALRQVGIRVPRAAVRVGAAAELAAGIGALVSGRPAFTAGVAVAYAVFAVFVAVALRRPEPVSDCGCFGGPETPPTLGHLAFDAAAAAVCLAATIRPVPGLVTTLNHQPLAGVPLIGMVALGGWLSWILLAVAPQTGAAAVAAAARRSDSGG